MENMYHVAIVHLRMKPSMVAKATSLLKKGTRLSVSDDGVVHGVFEYIGVDGGPEYAIFDSLDEIDRFVSSIAKFMVSGMMYHGDDGWQFDHGACYKVKKDWIRVGVCAIP